MKFWERIQAFFSDVKKELQRTSWPSRAEVQGTTIVVLVSVLIISVYLGLVDLVLAFLQQRVLFKLIGN